MNDKDKEAFVKWYSKETASVLWEDFNGDEIVVKAWQAAITFERKRGKKLLKMCELSLENIEFMLEVHEPNLMIKESQKLSFDVWQQFYLQKKKLNQALKDYKENL